MAGVTVAKEPDTGHQGNGTSETDWVPETQHDE